MNTYEAMFLGFMAGVVFTCIVLFIYSMCVIAQEADERIERGLHAKARNSSDNS